MDQAAAESSNPNSNHELSLEQRFHIIRSVGEECIQEDELRNMLAQKPEPICYDGFEPSGRMHIGQGVMKTINVNKLTSSGCRVKIWIADWFAKLNNKMGGDLKIIETKVVKEKNALAERLKNTEAARKRFDEELKRYATENVAREEIRQSLEDEVRRLTQTVGQTEEEKRQREVQVARCEAYIDGMESKLQTCKVTLAYNKDPSSVKLNLGVGAYRT